MAYVYTAVPNYSLPSSCASYAYAFKRSRPSVPHGTNFFIIEFGPAFCGTACVYSGAEPQRRRLQVMRDSIKSAVIDMKSARGNVKRPLSSGFTGYAVTLFSNYPIVCQLTPRTCAKFNI